MTEIPVKSNNFVMMCAVISALLLFLTVAVVQAKSQSRQQVRGLGEQVQDIKSEVLTIAKELDQLEAQLLYPSHTQISIFVSLRNKAKFRLDSVDIEFDGKEVTNHLYTSREMEALTMGGVQKIYTGNVAIGKHELKVTMRGKSAAGDRIRIVKSFPIEKKVKPRIAELLLSGKTITLINR